MVGRAAYGVFRAVHEVMIGGGPVMYGHNMALSRPAWEGIRSIVTTGDGAISEDPDVTLALLHTGRRIIYEPEMLVTIAVERTLRCRKLPGTTGPTDSRWRSIANVRTSHPCSGASQCESRAGAKSRPLRRQLWRELTTAGERQPERWRR